MLALSSLVDNAPKADGVRALKRANQSVRCSVCKGVFAGRIPKGGDGSILIPYRHSRVASEFPEYRMETCPGSLQSANAVKSQPTNERQEEREQKEGIECS